MDQKQLVDFYHKAAGSQVKKTWLAAIKMGSYASWPGLGEALVARHLVITYETVMSHLQMRRQGVQSTTQLKRDTGDPEQENPKPTRKRP